jgi:hypothetical protein
MIEVFKTNVRHPAHARLLVQQIHDHFPGYKANFDLDDCDRILRVQAGNDTIHPEPLIKMLGELGCVAEVLPDDEPVSALLSQARATAERDSRQVSKRCFGNLVMNFLK